MPKHVLIEKYLHHYHHYHLLLFFISLIAFNEASKDHLTTCWIALIPFLSPPFPFASLVDNLTLWAPDFGQIPFHAQWIEMMKCFDAEAVHDVKVQRSCLRRDWMNSMWYCNWTSNLMILEQLQIFACKRARYQTTHKPRAESNMVLHVSHWLHTKHEVYLELHHRYKQVWWMRGSCVKKIQGTSCVQNGVVVVSCNFLGLWSLLHDSKQVLIFTCPADMEQYYHSF